MKPARTPRRTLVYIFGTVLTAGIGMVAAANRGREVAATPTTAALSYKSTQSRQEAAPRVANWSAAGNVSTAGGGTGDGSALYTASAAPGTDTTGSGVNLHSGDVMSVHMTYDGTTLSWTITDTTTSWTIVRAPSA